jgi:hypothetical protein
MIIDRNNVVEMLSSGAVKTSVVYPITRDRHFVVTKETNVELSDGKIITIPKGFVFNGSSSPRFLWWIFPSYGNFFFAALVHDYLYDIRYKFDKKYADKEMLFWSNLVNKRNFAKVIDNYMRYYAVALFGRKQYLD